MYSYQVPIKDRVQRVSGMTTLLDDSIHVLSVSPLGVHSYLPVHPIDTQDSVNLVRKYAYTDLQGIFAPYLLTDRYFDIKLTIRY